MNSLKNLRRYLNSGNINTITVDIFDTILLRRIWPEGLQFLKAAEAALPLFHKYIQEEITPYEIYTWREHTRKEVLNAKRQDFDADNDVDLTLDEWFSELYSLLCAKYHGVSQQAPKPFVDELIRIELELEKQSLFPNLALVDTLREAKTTNPQLKVYFLSDMYLTTAQVEDLLTHHGIADVFDGGTTSVDTGNAKHSGRLFYHVHTNADRFVDLNLASNIHIGDSRHADVRMAEVAGSKAVLYSKLRARKLRTFTGRLVLRIQKATNRRSENRAYERALRSAYPREHTHARYFHDLGFLFAQPMAAYLLHVGEMAKLVPDKHYIFVSSEAGTFIDAGKKLFGGIYDKPKAALKLNRKRTISAVIWKLLQQKNEALITKIVRVVKYGEVSEDRKELYDFLLTSKFPVDKAEINALSKKQFYSKLYADLQSADPHYTKHLKEDFDYVSSTLPGDGKGVVICDVGWGGTVQAMYTLFAELVGYKGKIEGLYLGVHPPTRFRMAPIKMSGYLLPNVLSRKQRGYWSAVIWEYVYTNKFQFEGDEERLGWVSEGLAHGYEYFRHTRLAPVEHFDFLAKARIKRLLRHPTNAEVDALSQIHYDFGFNDPQILTIVDTTTPRWRFWARILLRPKATLGEVIAPNNWTGGYIKRFRLIGVPTLLKVLGRLKHTNYL